MEFETRIVNGKPSIYFKNDLQNNSPKKVNTKDVKAKKEIKRSMEISGEIDKVKPSPRQNGTQNDNQLKMILNVLNQNGVKLSQNQITALLEQMQKNEKGSMSNFTKATENINIHNSNSLNESEQTNLRKTKLILNQDQMLNNHGHQITNFNQNGSKEYKNISDIENKNEFSNRVSLIEKKKLKWQQDKELTEKLNQQDNNNLLKTVSPKRFQYNQPNISQKDNFYELSGQNKLTLTEKKKIQWQKEREEADIREQKLMPYDSKRYTRNLNDFSPELKTSNEKRSILLKTNERNNSNNDLKFAEITKNLNDNNRNHESVINLLRKSNSLNNLDNDQKNVLPNELNKIQHGNIYEKKLDLDIEKDDKYAYSPNEKKNNKNQSLYSNQIEEFKKIKEQIDQITAVENSLKNEEKISNNEFKLEENKRQHDQSRVPAAMRTSISFGGVFYDDDIKKTKELERQKWLQELEEQKKEKNIETPRQNIHYKESYSPFNLEQKNFEEKSFGRTRNLLDPAQIDELERRKKQSLQHKLEIEAQIAEKKRIKMIEEEIQNLSNLKIENEALEIKQASKLNEERKKLNSHYQNFEKILNSSRPSNTDVSPSVLQGEYNKYDQETKAIRNNITETRSQEIYRKMQEAELAAAEEKHKKLLKRLQKGGHDTTQLEKKFAELKAKLTRNPEHLLRDASPQMVNNEFKLIESNRTNNNLSHMSEFNLNEINTDTNYNLSPNKVLESNDRSTIQQIFKLLRGNSAGLPAEIKEEDLKLLLKNAVKPKEILEGKKKIKNNKEIKNKNDIDYEDEKSKVGVGKDGKPIWNYKNPKGKKAVSNSQKDPFYQKRAQMAEEKKAKRIEYYKSFNQRDKRKSKDNDNNQSHRSGQINEDNLSLMYDNLEENLQSDYTKNDNKMQTESIMNLLSKNLANNPIYEEDEDLYLHDNYTNNKSDLYVKDSNYMNMGENSSRGFVPFMRTNEVLDPVHAGSPVPPSRESSAIKRDREKARQAYIQNMRPSDYGFNYDEMSHRNQTRDPLLNNGLVKNNPTPRQEQILNQLASLKQSLINKQKEIASSIYNDSTENFD